MTVSTLNTVSPSTYQYTPSASTGSVSPVVSSNDPGLAQQVGALSVTEGVVATLGSAPSATQTYDAAGLYNSIAQAGTSTSTTPTVTVPSAGSNVQQAAQQSTDSSIVGSLPSSSAASGFYTGSGVLQSASTNSATYTANWASALKANPNLSHVVAADSFAQGIVGTLSVTA